MFLLKGFSRSEILYVWVIEEFKLISVWPNRDGTTVTRNTLL